MSIFCTISTRSHLFKSLALADGLNQFGYKLSILLIDESDDALFDIPDYVNISNLTAIKESAGLEIIKKYSQNKDKLRWALKPIWLLELLNKYDKIIYVDNDIYFYANPSFLFDELNSSKLLLTPHFYPANPEKMQNWLEANFKVGLYNAGFIATNKHAKEMLQWWAKCCLYKLTKSTSRGLFDDQKYLDLLPIQFEGIQILKHKGCNLAGWNSMNYQTQGDNMTLKIEHVYPVIFIHFADLSMRKFSKPTSAFFPYYQLYISELRKYKSNYTFNKKQVTWYQISSFIDFLIWNLKRIID